MSNSLSHNYFPTLSSVSNPSENEEALTPISISIQKSAILLGVSERTIWGLVRKGILPSLRIGTRVLIAHSSLVGFVNSNMDTSGVLVRPDRSEHLKKQNVSRNKNAPSKKSGGENA